MMYEELIKALRCCAMANGGCETECPYYDHAMCTDEVKFDAAAAIEDLEARLGEAENSVERWKYMYLTKHEPKRGEWLNVTDSFSWYGKCSVCGEEFVVDAYYAGGMNYCPNCGAKMGGME